VLLVDDEDIVRATTSDMLCELAILWWKRRGDRGDRTAKRRAAAGHDRHGPSDARHDRHRFGARGAGALAGDRLPADLRYAETECIAPDIPRLTKPFRQADLSAALQALATRA
jgi:hypothetical protein